MQSTHFKKGETKEAQIDARSSPLTQLSDLAVRWDNDASRLTRYGAEASAITLRRCAVELGEAITREDDATVNLSTASAITAYSPDHLGKLVREGKLKNYGAKHRPRIRVADLPKKPARVATGIPRTYDPSTDARNLRSRGRRVA